MQHHVENINEKIAKIEADIKKLQNVPVRCEWTTHEMLKQHDKQLWLIETKLKPPKKEAPLFFRQARTIFSNEKRKV